ncbi:MAG: tripartite tricarboxylate transporter TctB family protein [Betaproteobacteria bacterium]|nr:tripartite tricarboxylate transporter TctB family protein [Betaproteobacteria bacterium]
MANSKDEAIDAVIEQGGIDKIVWSEGYHNDEPVEIYAQDYSLGNSRRMGPAFFPTLLAIIQIVMALLVLVLAFARQNADEEPMAATDFKGMGLILASDLVFAQALPIVGFAVATPILVMLSAMASPESTWKERIWLAIILTISCILVFKVGLEMPLKVWPWNS